MEKIKLNKEEFEAMEKFIDNDMDFKKNIEFYIKYNKEWLNSYTPLREMGFEKFVKCLTVGYELEMPSLPKTITDSVDVSFNYNTIEFIKRNPYTNVYLRVRNFDACSCSIENARDVIKGLEKIIDYYDKYIK